MTTATTRPNFAEAEGPDLRAACPHCGGGLALSVRIASEEAEAAGPMPPGDAQQRQRLRDSGKGKPTCPLCGGAKGLEYKICADCYKSEQERKGICQRCGERRCSPGYVVCWSCSHHDPADDPEYGGIDDPFDTSARGAPSGWGQRFGWEN